VEVETVQMEKLKAIWDEHLQVSRLLPSLTLAVASAVDHIYSSLAAGGQLLIAGNGGSAADAQHASITRRSHLLEATQKLDA